MATVVITSLSSTTSVYLGDLYLTLAPRAVATVQRPAAALQGMVSLQSAIQAGTISVAITPTAAELASGYYESYNGVVTPAVVAFNVSGQVMPSGAPFTVITGWTTISDTSSIFVPSTGRVTVPTAGLYLASGAILTSSSVPQNNNVYLSFLNNASEVLRGTFSNPATGGATSNACASVNGIIKAAKNDVITMGVTQFSGSGITLFASGISNTLSVVRIAV